ncbi:MAG: AgmX/PglI C-terminal domain-containing protein [Alphaproteobacteria bacterium]|nr:AgmX/PglI C-terminal domain-containing protein [Alphaproteobacteria bacterium]
MAQARKSKVLRIAIIQDRKIKQERLIKAGESVRIGDDPKKNTFVIPKNNVTGSSFVLFQSDGSNYSLRFNDQFGAKSKVSTGGLAAKLSNLLNDSSVNREGDVAVLPLTPSDRGKLDIDGTFILFQFVAPPPVKAVKPIKAMDFRPRLLEDDDPVFLGFLAIWSALALVLTVWVWNSEKPEYSLDELPDRFAKLALPPPKVEEPPEPLEDPNEVDETLESPDKTKAEAAEPEPSKAKKNDVDEDPGKQAKNLQDTKDNLEKSSKLLAKILATTGDNSRGMVADMWSDEDKGLANIDKALAEKSGGLTTDANDPGIREGAGGGTGEAATIGDLAATGAGGTSGVGGGPAVKVEGSVSMGNGSVSEEIGDSGKVKNTVRRYAGQMKYCYEQQLKKNSSLEGRVELGWSVYEGKVESVYVVSNGTGDDELSKCMMSKLKKWKFDGDIEGDVQWPFVFRPKN